MHMDSNLSISLNLLRCGNKSAGREDNVGVAGAGATVANVGAVGVDESYDGDGRRDLLRDGPEYGGGGGGEDDGGDEGDGGGEVDGGGDGDGDGDAATH
ncbi:hypothetical protein Tco_0145983 [Tanacetum coccineum]